MTPTTKASHRIPRKKIIIPTTVTLTDGREKEATVEIKNESTGEREVIQNNEIVLPSGNEFEMTFKNHDEWVFQKDDGESLLLTSHTSFCHARMPYLYAR